MSSDVARRIVALEDRGHEMMRYVIKEIARLESRVAALEVKPKKEPRGANG